jgi:hypothetical protein
MHMKWISVGLLVFSYLTVTECFKKTLYIKVEIALYLNKLWHVGVRDLRVAVVGGCFRPLKNVSFSER